MNSESGTEEQIKAFARDLYNVQFPLFKKIEVNGEGTHEVFKFVRVNSVLNRKDKGDVREVPWNFTKWLIDENGKVVAYFNPRVLPNEMEGDIKRMLGVE
jgi:glutathione peroxidase